jgi:hypothetical protein
VSGGLAWPDSIFSRKNRGGLWAVATCEVKSQKIGQKLAKIAKKEAGQTALAQAV